MDYTPDYKQKINTLKKQVGDYDNSVKPKSDVTNIFKSFLKPTYIYISIPIITTILFVLFKPSCVLSETTDENGETQYSLKFSKLITATLVSSACIIIGIYIYFKKSNLTQV